MEQKKVIVKEVYGKMWILFFISILLELITTKTPAISISVFMIILFIFEHFRYKEPKVNGQFVTVQEYYDDKFNELYIMISKNIK